MCASACPEFRHNLAGRGAAKDFCELCGAAIYKNEGYYRRGEVSVCSDCEACMSMDELRLLTGSREPLLNLGFEKVD